MIQQPHPQNTKDAPRASTWKESFRRHVTGPVFSLSVHILILAVLGSIVVAVVPDESQDDVAVEIAEAEPVLPREQQEEPMPADTTVLDLPTLSLDRYDSAEQRIMDEVGVTSREIVANVDIQSPVVIPDNMSALKLQGVRPFGRPGGGGRAGTGEDSGKSGEDGGSTLYGSLQGVFYDLKQTKDRKATDAMGNPTAKEDYARTRILPVLKSFVNGPWKREYDKAGQVHYPELDEYYCSPTRLWNSCFYAERIEADVAPAAFGCGPEVSPGGWVCIYSGHVVAPFSGKFRFVGFADDILLIRFQQTIVLDFGMYSATLGDAFFGLGDFKRILSGHPETERQRRMIAESPLYSKYMLDVYFPSFDNGHGIAKSPVMEVQEGQVYPIEIMIAEVPGGKFSMLLFVERLDEHGEPLEPNPESLMLFRTTLDLPERSRQGDFPPFKPYGPVWRVVNSDEASEGADKKSGKLPTSVLDVRVTARPEVVNEDDEDLTL